jgi:putative redox protein
MAVVTAELHEGTKVTLHARTFTVVGDEPTHLGGTDLGPTPYEILLGGLATCIAATLRLYADHKGIPLEGVRVTLDFDRVHADDCLDCDERGDALIERIKSEVTIIGDFDEAQRKRLAQVARRCPVHKTMSNGLHISDSVGFEPGAGTSS